MVLPMKRWSLQKSRDSEGLLPVSCLPPRQWLGSVREISADCPRGRFETPSFSPPSRSSPSRSFVQPFVMALHGSSGFGSKLPAAAFPLTTRWVFEALSSLGSGCVTPGCCFPLFEFEKWKIQIVADGDHTVRFPSNAGRIAEHPNKVNPTLDPVTPIVPAHPAQRAAESAPRADPTPQNTVRWQGLESEPQQVLAPPTQPRLHLGCDIMCWQAQSPHLHPRRGRAHVPATKLRPPD